MTSPLSPQDRDGEKRLELLLLQLRDVLDAGVVEQVLPDERRLAPLGRPPCEPLARSRQFDLAGEMRIRLRCGPEHELVSSASTR